MAYPNARVRSERACRTSKNAGKAGRRHPSARFLFRTVTCFKKAYLIRHHLMKSACITWIAVLRTYLHLQLRTPCPVSFLHLVPHQPFQNFAAG